MREAPSGHSDVMKRDLVVELISCFFRVRRANLQVPSK